MRRHILYTIVMVLALTTLRAVDGVVLINQPTVITAVGIPV